jgi:hypothetical protein
VEGRKEGPSGAPIPTFPGLAGRYTCNLPNGDYMMERRKEKGRKKKRKK